MLERYVIHVTKKCNMKCLYCYEDDKVSEYTWEEIKALLSNIIKYNKHFGIEFLGGEPLIAMSLIEKSVDFLESQPNIDVSDYVITTNGTLITPNIIGYLMRNPKVKRGMSLDGNNYANQLRVMKDGHASGNLVANNIKMLLREIDINRISVHMVTHPYNVGLLNDSIDYLYNLGIRVIGIGTIEKTIIINDEYCDRFIQEMNKLSDKIISGVYKSLYIDLLEYLKPQSDQRTYIRDTEGKLIAESYGRSEDDITSKRDYNSKIVTSDLGDTIDNLRETIFNNHQRKLTI